MSATPAAAPVAAPLPAWRRRAALAVPWLLALLLVCVAIQAYLGGAGLLADDAYLAAHKSFVHAFELLPVLLAVAGFLGRDKGAGWGGAALFFLIGLQYPLIRAPDLVDALHVVNALVVSGLCLALLLHRLPWGTRVEHVA